MARLKKVTVDGRWWAQTPDGHWLMWNEMSSGWELSVTPPPGYEPPPPTASPEPFPSLAAPVQPTWVRVVSFIGETVAVAMGLTLILGGAAFIYMAVVGGFVILETLLTPWFFSEPTGTEVRSVRLGSIVLFCWITAPGIVYARRNVRFENIWLPLGIALIAAGLGFLIAFRL